MTKARDAISGVETVIDGHGTTLHDWTAFRFYAAFTQAVADAARRAHRNRRSAEQMLASLEDNSAIRPFVDNTVLQGARGRALNAINAALQVLSGEPPAPPAPSAR